MPKNSRPTIQDVAERAGVSVGTVSNVLNGTTRVSVRRQRRVLQAIDVIPRDVFPIIGIMVGLGELIFFLVLVVWYLGLLKSLQALIPTSY